MAATAGAKSNTEAQGIFPSIPGACQAGCCWFFFAISTQTSHVRAPEMQRKSVCICLDPLPFLGVKHLLSCLSAEIRIWKYSSVRGMMQTPQASTSPRFEAGSLTHRGTVLQRLSWTYKAVCLETSLLTAPHVARG